VPIEMLTKPEQRVSPPVDGPIEDDGLHALTQRQAKRVRRLKINVAAWGLGTILLTTAWTVHEWQANGAFERFAHEGNPGDWNPTLWALAVLLWGLMVGIMALRVYFERPAKAANTRLERLSRLRFQVAAWLLGMIMLTPVNALIEWQDNGGFQRFSRNSHPGSWDPWILYVGGVWAVVIAVFFAWPVYLDRRKTEAEAESDVKRLESSS
jgi:hypothetical protein